ncbi:hypothetical protein C8R44DRAFT_784677 [Mycena epipterygia]|nr:hypothetical protein C8R44DRAFT_784677 [Mycena epipterygia]
MESITNLLFHTPKSTAPPPKRIPEVHFLNVGGSAPPFPVPKLEHTHRLLHSIVAGLRATEARQIRNAYEIVYMRIWVYIYNSLLSEDIRAKLDSLRDVRLLNHLSKSDLQVCITNHLEQPWTGLVLWGETNWKVDIAAELGLLIPAINGGLCAAYEATFCENSSTDADLVLSRAQLGTLISITFLHELAKSWIRLLLKEVLSDNWVAADIDGSPNELGFELEKKLFHGSLKVLWNSKDLSLDNRFSLVQGLWLQPSTDEVVPQSPAPSRFELLWALWREPPNLKPLRRIPPGNIMAFCHKLSNGDITTDTLETCFLDPIGCMEYTTAGQLTATRDRRLFSLTKQPRSGVYKTPVQANNYPMTCLVAVRRAAERDPEIREKYKTFLSL